MQNAFQHFVSVSHYILAKFLSDVCVRLMEFIIISEYWHNSQNDFD